jgi:hypothetical protein
MKKTLLAISIVASSSMLLLGCNNAEENNQNEQEVLEATEFESEKTEVVQDTIKGSIPSEASGKIGEANIKINYHAPGVKGRFIWGGLVPYGQVWVTGAHMATSFETDKNLLIGGKELKAGKYGLFTIPGKDEWTLIINKNWKQHLADNYAEADDVLRVEVKPEDIAQHQEGLRYELIEKDSGKGALRILWDKVGITIPIEVKQ